MTEYRAGEDPRPDEFLIKGFLAGDAGDFNILYERYRKPLYAYLNRMMPGKHAVIDDVFQQTWIKVVRKLPKYKCQQKFLAWIIRIAHNLAVDQFRRNKRQDDSVPVEERREELLSDSAEPWRSLDREEMARILKWALDQLNPELKEVFLLRQEELSFKEIAAVQGCSINTVLGRMQYALRNLRKLLTEWKAQGM